MGESGAGAHEAGAVACPAVPSAPASRAARARGIIIGFACTQAFIYALFYLNPLRGGVLDAQVGLTPHLFRVDLLAVLLLMLVGLALAGLLTRGRARLLCSRVVLVLCAVLPLGAAAFLLLATRNAGDASAPLLLVLACVASALPASVLLCAWGRVMGEDPVGQSVPELFIASALGAALCFALGTVPVEGATAFACVLPAVSAWLLGRLCPQVDAKSLPTAARPVESALDDDAGKLSGRIALGTGAYGLAAGLAETLGTGAAAPSSSPSSTLMLLLFVLYCLAALQLFGGSVQKDGANPGAAQSFGRFPRPTADDSPLGGSYRLAILLVMAGFLLLPVLSSAGVPRESVVLAGYLGIWVVLAALFLVMGRLSGNDVARSFSRGFLLLFAGEAAGVLVGSLISQLPFPSAATLSGALAGIGVLYGFLFLFTERDMRDLSVVLDRAGGFERTCERIASDAGLSKREAEILPLALRGRTGERIAAELFISKNTVDTHLRRIYGKCGVHSRQELIDLGERVQAEGEGRFVR